MGRGKSLTDVEMGQILVLSGEGKGHRYIANKVGRSKTVVTNFLRNPEKYGKNYETNKPTKTTTRDVRLIFRETRKGKIGSKGIVSALDLSITARRVRQILNSSKNFKYCKRKHMPNLTPRHKKARVKFGRDNHDLGEDWNKVVFSDEKKFNLDGPDGCQMYWHCLDDEPQWFSKRQGGGQSVMVWACFSAAGKSQIAFLTGRQKSADYISTLGNYLLPFLVTKHDDGYIFQQDNASIHASRETTAWLESNEIVRMEWPALSPDLNPIENLWAVLVRKIYAGGRQFHGLDELKREIERAWHQIPLTTLHSLVDSMPKRCFQVGLTRGGKTKY
jgi:transposase